jgi:RimJ/RimL family protein N-acetyltransferase
MPASMPASPKPEGVPPNPHEQMLRLVARGFHRELIKYGVKEPEIVTVAAHLLDNVVLKSPPASKPAEKYNQLFTIRDVRDDWAGAQRLGLHDVTLTPLDLGRVRQVAGWLENPRIRSSFFPRFPESVEKLTAHFRSPDQEYFAIWHQQDFVGIVGAENLDPLSAKLEMKKLVGDPNMRGKGIGKRATFLFLYHVFVIRKFYKVYLHTLDINIRNLNLNGNLGFSLEGVFFDDVCIDGIRQDVVRMALTEPAWRKIFG